MEFEAVIGLEVHAQLLTRSKIFCACSTRFGDSANANTCPVCLGLPGALPVLNREVVSMAIKAALALGCRINRHSIFARKNYFYPDLPKGYQISQYDQPLAEHGQAVLLSGERTEKGNIVNRVKKSFGIHRIHLEEDAGKSIHGTSFRDAHTLINLNRSGVPLIEIVSEPNFRTSQEAYDYLTHLRKTLLYLGVCDGNMEEGSLRCDANVSVRPVGQERFGTKIEIKNLNSFRFLQKALDYEIRRQVEALRRGEVIYQETRLWDEEAGMTSVMRTKEEAHDYRYFPEPDLLPLFIDDAWLGELQQSMPELPEDRRQRFETEYGLSIDESLLLVSQPETAEYYEQVLRSGCSPRLTANWILGELFYELKNSGKEIGQCPVPPASLGELILQIERNEISSKMAKTVFCEMFANGEKPSVVIERLGLAQISDTSLLEGVIAEVLAENPRQLAEYRGGKEKLYGFFVGQVMKKTSGQANPQRLNEILKKLLAG